MRKNNNISYLLYLTLMVVLAHTSGTPAPYLVKKPQNLEKPESISEGILDESHKKSLENLWNSRF